MGGKKKKTSYEEVGMIGERKSSIIGMDELLD